MSNTEDVSRGLIGNGAVDQGPPSAHARRLIERLVSGLRAGQLRVVLPSGPPLRIAGREPGPRATVIVKRWRALRLLALGGDIGFAESFVDGDWTSPDLVALVRLAARNMEAFDRAINGSNLLRAGERLRHLLRRNSRRGSRRNILAHYDLGNSFYSLWLDGTMQYSSGIFEDGAETLETAQARKIGRIAELLKLDDGERVLEIGCGWGGLAERLAAEKKALVTALTLSPSQRAWASGIATASGLADRINVRLQDYRDVGGSFDRIVSIEMLEAVGEAWWPTYFRVLGDRLMPGGRAVLQVITIAEERYEAYRRTPDFIQKHIFPGGFLPSSSALEAQIASAGLRLTHSETFGSSYARTLAHWRARFVAHWPEIAAQGFDERFQRLWTYYLCYCEAGFAEGAINVGLYVIEREALCRPAA
jgi:cyclopropane-fatty-acyl-phospholipid synthase